MDISTAVIVLFLVLFTAIAILSICSLPGWIKIEDRFRNKLFVMLILQVVGTTVSLATLAVRRVYADNPLVINADALKGEWTSEYADGQWVTNGHFTKKTGDLFEFSAETYFKQRTLDGKFADPILYRTWRSAAPFSVPINSTKIEFDYTMHAIATTKEQTLVPQNAFDVSGKMQLDVKFALCGFYIQNGDNLKGGMAFTPAK